jgi:tetraprenyl-beta-curcumene synthase
VCRRGPSARRTRREASPRNGTPDPAPFTRRQITALISGATRELLWALPAVSREVGRWRHRASAIPDAPIRHDALDALRRKRGQTDGAALFSIIPLARSPSLLRTLATYQILWDFLDSVGERAPSQENGRQLNRALIDALDPDRPLCDYYRHHPWHNDGGYLRALVITCRESCVELPSYQCVRSVVSREARRAEVLAINHDRDPERRIAMLKGWAEREFPSEHEASWFELSGAASAGLTIFALLALATEHTCSDADVTLTLDAYFPWPGALATMLDSYVDQHEDTANGDHLYIAYYRTPVLATHHTRQLVQRTMQSVCVLPDPQKHILIMASMLAMYLSKDSARTPDMHDSTQHVAEAGGSLTRALLPILRLWRTIYGLRSA